VPPCCKYDEASEIGESALKALPLERPAAEAASERLADYLRRLDTEPLSVLQSGEVKFPEINMEFREMAPRKAENFGKKG
jgi:hypothetical protein